MERLFSSPFTSHKEVVDEAYRIAECRRIHASARAARREAFLNRKPPMPESQPWTFDAQPRREPGKPVRESTKEIHNYTPLIELEWPPIDVNALHLALKAKDV